MKTVCFAAIAVLLPLSAFAGGPPRCPHIQKAQFHLAQSRAELDTAAHDFKGHRAKALDLVRQAEAELAQASAAKGCK